MIGDRRVGGTGSGNALQARAMTARNFFAELPMIFKLEQIALGSLWEMYSGNALFPLLEKAGLMTLSSFIFHKDRIAFWVGLVAAERDYHR